MIAKSIFKKPNGHAPVDRHEVEWFHVYVSDKGCRISPFKAVYFVRSTYSDVLAGSRGDGADFVDQWLIYENGRTIGRWNSWEYPFKDNDYWLNCRTTQEAARARAVALLSENVVAHRSIIETLEQNIRANMAEGEKVSDGHNP